MTQKQPMSFISSSAAPLIGVLTEENGKEIVQYFMGDEQAEQALSS